VHLLKSSVDNILRFTCFLIRQLSQLDEQVFSKQPAGFKLGTSSPERKLFIILSHAATDSTCQMICWAASACLKDGYIIFDAEEDGFCPDCASRGVIGSSLLQKKAINSGSFDIKQLPRPSKVVVIRQSSGHFWSSV